MHVQKLKSEKRTSTGINYLKLKNFAQLFTNTCDTSNSCTKQSFGIAE